MHPTFYNLSADPFRLSPDPRFCFPHRTYRKAMTYMQHALLRAEGFIVITGQPGMGKTTLINDLFRGLDTRNIQVARLVSTQLLADDLLRLVAYELDLDANEMDKASVLNRVGIFLKQQHRDGRRTLLVVDEAQDVSGEALEELRLLTNIQHEGHQLLQIFLVGQEELRDVMSAPELVQLHQRVIAAAHIAPLDATETREYIKHRLRRVGWEGDPLISDQTYAMIHHFSRGIPRQINQICSRLLLHGSIEERHRLGLEDLRTVIDELHSEMLLPLGMQEIADTVIWPSESLEETYDERPLARNGQSSTDSIGSENGATLPTSDGITRTGDADDTATTPDIAPPSSPDRDTGSRMNDRIVDTPRPGRPERPTTPPRPDIAARRSRPTAGNLAAALLLGGVLLASLLAFYTETGQQLRHDLVDRLAWIERYLARTGSTLSLPKPETTEVASTVAEAPVTTDGGNKDDQAYTVPAEGVVPVEEFPPQSDAPPPEAVAAGDTADQSQPTLATNSGFTAIAPELAAKDLDVTQLKDGNLKVGLSTVGMFEFNSARLKANAAAQLASLAIVLNRHEEAEVRIVGHTDSMGEPEYNLFLSRQRARAVADYLVEQGLQAARIRSEGRGDLDTRHETATQDKPDLRRRVEVFIRPLGEGG